MDHEREHRTPPTSKGHGSGYTTTCLDCVLDVYIVVHVDVVLWFRLMLMF